ncbi:Gti1/Pac2 family-domain-containing protein [Abortiporus biennis]|nr:Gti1/Pac2 family-domain-containing protein [Abortiporus biennis]
MASPPSSRLQSIQTVVTHPALHLRDARDAHIVFEAVRLKILPLVTRRLTAAEREQLTSGNVYVWEEAEHKQVGGLERWTDGRRWSQSRMRGDYLFYEEKIETTPEEKEAKAARRARRTLDPFSYQPAPTRRQDRPSKPDGLTKQTYSTHVQLGASDTPRKWHIVAYFSGEEYMCLPNVDNYEYLRNIRIPEGVYSSARGNLNRLQRPTSGSDEPEHRRPPSADHPGWSSPPWAQPPHSYQQGIPDRPLSPASSSCSSPVLSPHSYSMSSRGSSILTRHREGNQELPRLSTIAPLLPPPQLHRRPGASGYSPLTSEDQRALNSFRVVL